MNDRGALPGLVSLLLRPAPRAPLAMLLTRAVRRILSERPELIDRLGDTAHADIAVVPSDLPFGFLIRLRGQAASVEVIDPCEADHAAARIHGPLLLLLGLLDGTYDGDALFFSRDLTIEGDTEHVLAMRNTLEEACLTPAEFVGLGGAAARMLDNGAGRALALARRILQAPPASPMT